MSMTSLPSPQLRRLAFFYSTLGGGGRGLAANCSPARIAPGRTKSSAKVNPAIGRSALYTVRELRYNIDTSKERRFSGCRVGRSRWLGDLQYVWTVKFLAG